MYFILLHSIHNFVFLSLLPFILLKLVLKDHQDLLVPKSYSFSSVLTLFDFLVTFDFFFLDSICLFLERELRREKKREGNISQLPFARPQCGAWPETQACALTHGTHTEQLQSGQHLILLTATSV